MTYGHCAAGLSLFLLRPSLGPIFPNHLSTKTNEQHEQPLYGSSSPLVWYDRAVIIAGRYMVEYVGGLRLSAGPKDSSFCSPPSEQSSFFFSVAVSRPVFRRFLGFLGMGGEHNQASSI
jgi:hypothetical protein